jgi:integrator complex subunit 4
MYVDISILVLVFNAAAGNRTALPMFQEHTWRHFTYLRDSIPELVPDLKVQIMYTSVLEGGWVYL